MLPRIFIGGTGRSGTSILYKALGCHDVIYSLPSEMRFLIDPDGLINLVDALTVKYSPVRARGALFRFERLMRVYLTVSENAPYSGFDFSTWLGGEYYWRRLNQFCSELVELEFSGTDFQVEPDSGGRLIAWVRYLQRLRQRIQGKSVVPTRLTLARRKLKLVRYFSNRSQLIKLVTSFIDDLFLFAARKRGKQTWCEKSPHNLLTVDFLWELFPESVFIHIKRDPRGVVQSLTKQPWAPKDIEAACLWLKHTYDRWFNVCSAIDLNNHRYYELKLEDLAASPHSVLEKVVTFCGLENRFSELPEITIEKVNHWQKTMKKEDKELVTDILGFYIEQMGYEI